MLVVIGTDCKESCKSKYHTITTTTAPQVNGTTMSIPFICFNQIFSFELCPFVIFKILKQQQNFLLFFFFQKILGRLFSFKIKIFVTLSSWNRLHVFPENKVFFYYLVCIICQKRNVLVPNVVIINSIL